MSTDGRSTTRGAGSRGALAAGLVIAAWSVGGCSSQPVDERPGRTPTTSAAGSAAGTTADPAELGDLADRVADAIAVAAGGSTLGSRVTAVDLDSARGTATSRVPRSAEAAVEPLLTGPLANVIDQTALSAAASSGGTAPEVTVLRTSQPRTSIEQRLTAAGFSRAGELWRSTSGAGSTTVAFGTGLLALVTADPANADAAATTAAAADPEPNDLGRLVAALATEGAANGVSVIDLAGAPAASPYRCLRAIATVETFGTAPGSVVLVPGDGSDLDQRLADFPRTASGSGYVMGPARLRAGSWWATATAGEGTTLPPTPLLALEDPGADPPIARCGGAPS